MKKQTLIKGLEVELLPDMPCESFELSPIYHPALPNGYCIKCGFEIQYHTSITLSPKRKRSK
jgi:hypothetical protein